jgi:hypothetical protein
LEAVLYKKFKTSSRESEEYAHGSSPNEQRDSSADLCASRQNITMGLI